MKSIKAIKEALSRNNTGVASALIQVARTELQALSVILGNDDDYAYNIVIKVYDKAVYTTGESTDNMFGAHMYTFFAESPREVDEIIEKYMNYGRLEPKDPYIRIVLLNEGC